MKRYGTVLGLGKQVYLFMKENRGLEGSLPGRQAIIVATIGLLGKLMISRALGMICNFHLGSLCLEAEVHVRMIELMIIEKISRPQLHGMQMGITT